MNLIEFREYCLSLGDVTEKTPFGKFARRYDSLLVFYVSGHMFCMVDMDNFTYVSVRSTAEVIDKLRLNYSSLSNPVNSTLRNWIELNLNGDIPESLVYDLTRTAYTIIREKYEKKPLK